MFAAIRLVVILVIVLLLAGGVWYVTGLRADLAVSEENNKKLENGIMEQQLLINQMKEDVVAIQKSNEELQAQNDKQKKDLDNLQNKFSDFGARAASNAEAATKAINRGTVNALRCLELASGAPLNEKEKQAKSPKEANRECPALIDPDFSPSLN
jgi:predicted RNase H-like nuclease (RuvC/YqgF family)